MSQNSKPQSSFRTGILILTPFLCLGLIFFFDLDPERPAVTRTAAVALLMAVWWITEAIPLAVTALLPMVLFPFLGILTGKEVAPHYFNSIIFLFIGGFIVALAMQRWNLHRRIALKIILWIGLSPKRIILGFMGATWFLSMWISNTATTMMMVPIALAVTMKLEENIGEKASRKFSVGLLLGIAYAASIGGMATLIGTPPNLAFAKILDVCFPGAPEISFTLWFSFALPLSMIFFLLVWGFLSFLFSPSHGTLKEALKDLDEEYQKLGPLSWEEKAVLVVFILMSLLWLTRSDIALGTFTIPGWSSLLSLAGFVDDGTVAMTMAILLFLIPARSSEAGTIMDWKTASGLPWGIVLLFGGGFALAAGFKESGLSTWLGNQLLALGTIHPLLLIASTCTMLTFLTELTSNTATTQIVLPILASAAVVINVHPFMLMIPATLSASCAFMLPVATPPNAIIFGTSRLRVSDMARTGLLLNLLGIILITAAMYLLALPLLGIEDIHQLPTWALNN